MKISKKFVTRDPFNNKSVSIRVTARHDWSLFEYVNIWIKWRIQTINRRTKLFDNMHVYYHYDLITSMYEFHAFFPLGWYGLFS